MTWCKPPHAKGPHIYFEIGSWQCYDAVSRPGLIAWWDGKRFMGYFRPEELRARDRRRVSAGRWPQPDEGEDE